MSEDTQWPQGAPTTASTQPDQIDTPAPAIQQALSTPPAAPVPGPDSNQDPSVPSQADNPARIAANAASSAPKGAPMWQRIVMGALVGAAGGATQKTAAGGFGAGVGAQLNYSNQQQQQQKEDTRQAQLLQFENVRAADSHIQALDQHNRADRLDGESKLDYNIKSASFQSFLADHPELGIDPDLPAVPDNSTSAQAGHQTLVDSNGGTIPQVATINTAAPHGTPGSIAVMSPSQKAMQSTQGYRNLIDIVRQVKGQPKMTDDQWKGTGFQDRKAAYTDAQNFINPTHLTFTFDKNKPDFIGTQLVTKQQQLANYQQHKDANGQPDADPAVVKQLQNGVDFLTTQQAKQQATENADAVGKINATAGPTAAADAAKINATAGPNAAAAAQKTTAEMTAKATFEAKNGSGDNTKTGEDFIATLPPGDQATVRAVGEGRMELSNRVVASKDGRKLANNINQAYPGFNQAKAHDYFLARQSFTSGPGAAAVENLNTAIGALGQMYETAGNAGWNWVPGAHGLGVSMGTDTATKLEAQRQIALGAITKAYSGGALDPGSRDKYMALLNPDVREGKMKKQIESLTGGLGDTLATYKHQWDAAKPSPAIPDFPIISQDSAATIQKITGKNVGFITPTQARVSQPGAEPPPTSVTTSDPASKFGGVTRKVAQ
jgi:hypothetical protein